MGNVPRLRFKEHQEEWINGNLRSLSTLITKGTTPSTFAQSGVLFVKIEALNGTSIDANKCQYIDTSVHHGELRRSILKENDILFAIAGATIGKLGVVCSSDLPANTNQALAIIRLKNKEHLPFVLQILQSSAMKRYIEESISVGAQPNLNLQQIGDFNFYQPSLGEQQKIAAFLSAVDTKIEQLTQKQALLEQYKKGVMQKIFSQEIRFKADDGSEFPEWQEKTLGEVVLSLSNGLSLEQNTEGSGYKVTRIETISNARINLSKVGFVETESDISNYKLNKGDMLFSNINSVQHIGKIAYVEKDFDLYHGMNLLRLIICADHDSKYLYYVLTSSWYKRYFERVCNKAVNQASINQADLRKTPLFMPSKREQTKIAHFISALDEQADKISQQLEAAKTFKKGLLQQMFV